MIDSKYRMKHKPPRITRLRYYRRPPPMVGNPIRHFQNWQHRAQVLYQLAMEQKRGIADAERIVSPPLPKQGLWFYS